VGLWLTNAKYTSRETFVNGLASIQELVPGIVRVSYYAQRRTGVSVGWASSSGLAFFI
jgi:hypothetical protein